MPYKFKVGDTMYSATDAIDPPYLPCPKCKKLGFGTLMVIGNRHIRRCIECSYPNPELGETHPHQQLPSLHKKVIYLDQFAISNLMMCINPTSKPFKKGVYRWGKKDYRWVKLYKKLDRLRQLQVIICPYSIFHREESLVASGKTPNMPKDLKRMYELMSYRVSFNTPDEIQNKQINQFAENWINNCTSDYVQLDVENVTRDSIHTWQKMGVITTWQESWTADDVARQRQIVDDAYDGLGDVHERWMSEEMTFDNRWKEEAESYGKSIMRVYGKYLSKRYAEVFFPQMVNQLESVSEWHPYVRLVEEIHQGFYRAGLRNEVQEIPESLRPMLIALGLEEDQLDNEVIHRAIQNAGLPNTMAMEKVGELLMSEIFWKEVPYARIQSLLWAVLANSGRRPERGDFADIEMLSCFMPYCDAMLVDKKWYNRLSSIQVKERINYNTKVFTTKHMDDFISFLDKLEREYEEEIRFAEKTFGKVKPYMSVYKDKPFNKSRRRLSEMFRILRSSIYNLSRYFDNTS